MKGRVGAFFSDWGKYDCAAMAAGIAYYGAVSLFPLTILLVALLGFVFRFLPEGADARGELVFFISRQISPEAGVAFSEVLPELEAGAVVNGPLALLGFLFAAALIFVRIDRGFVRIWDKRKRASEHGFWPALHSLLSSGLRAVILILSVALLVAMMFVGGLVGETVDEFGEARLPKVFQLLHALGGGMRPLVNVVVLTLLYWFLSRGPVSWRPCLIGSVVAAVLWELGSQLLLWLSFGSNLSIYGLIGSFLVVLLWIYYNVLVLFIGALMVKHLALSRVQREVREKKRRG